MRIGIVSDSHDHLTHLEKAVELLNERKVEAWIHLGDFVSPFTAGPLGKLPDKRTLIFGNNDGDIRLLLEQFGGEIRPRPFACEYDGRSFLLMHEPYALEAATRSGLYDVVLYGHTHQIDYRREGGTIVLNPGECCGWLTGTPTCAVLDTRTLRAEVLTVHGDAVELEGTGP